MAHPLLQAVFVTPEGTAHLPIQPDLLRVRPGGICKTRLFRGYDPVPEKGLRNPKYTACPMTKYYYPEEYGLEPDNGSDKQ